MIFVANRIFKKTAGVLLAQVKLNFMVQMRYDIQLFKM